MKIKKLDHINIVVSDITKSVDFYTKVFGFVVKMKTNLNGEWFDSLTNQSESEAICVFLEMPNSNFRIELLQYVNPKTKLGNLKSELNCEGVRHIAFEVDNIEEVIENVEKFGVEKRSEIIQVPLSILATGKKLCYINAPDDVIIELAQYNTI